MLKGYRYKRIVIVIFLKRTGVKRAENSRLSAKPRRYFCSSSLCNHSLIIPSEKQGLEIFTVYLIIGVGDGGGGNADIFKHTRIRNI